MVTEAMLQTAAIEAENYFVSALPVDNAQPHVFSRRFEKKIEKLIRRVKRPVRYKVLRSAAAVVLAIMTLFGALFAFSPEVRADVIRWLKDTFKEFTTYTNTGATEGTAEIEKHKYQLGMIPEGYRELTVIDQADGQTYIYFNESGLLLQFVYSLGEREESLFIKTEGFTQTTVSVNGITADFYLTANEKETNAIIWHNPKTGVLFQIYAKEDKDILIKLAESVQVKES